MPYYFFVLCLCLYLEEVLYDLMMDEGEAHRQFVDEVAWCTVANENVLYIQSEVVLKSNARVKASHCVEF